MIRYKFSFVFAFILIHFFSFSQNKDNEFNLNKQYDSLVYLYQNVYLGSTQERVEVIKLLVANSFDGKNTLGDRIKYLNEGILILERWDSTKLLIKAYNSLGRLYWLNGNPNKSIQSVYKVAELSKSINDIYWEAAAYANLGDSYKIQKDFNRALTFEKKALLLYEKQKDTLELFNINSSISETYFQLKKIDSCKLIIEKALIYFNPVDPSHQYINARLQGTQAKLFAIERDYDSAKVLINESAKILSKYQSSQLNQSTALDHIELAKILLDHGKPDEAIEFAIKGYQIGQQHQLKEVIRDGAKVLAEANEKINPTKALQYLKTHHAYSDSITNVENVKQIESLRADFEINQKQTELDVVEVRRRNQELVSYITGGVLFLMAILAIIVYRNYRQKLALSKQLALTNESKNKLFSIISHDLRGPMAAFSGVGFMIKSALQTGEKSFLEEVATEVDKSSKQLSSLLENLLTWAMQEQDGLSVHQEKINTKDVFSELKDMFESQAKLKNIMIKIDDVKSCDVNADRNMTYTIFRNLISNALKFTPENGKIIISSSIENDCVQTEVRDTGVGMSQEKVDAIFKFDSKKSTYGTSGEKGLGLGLQLVSEFVEINGGSIHVESEEGRGTTFVVNLPVFKEV